MIPPSFSDLGKAAKDLFDKKFKFGLLSVDCATSRDPVNIKIDASHDLKTKSLTGLFESKHKASHGISATTKWTTKNVLTTDLTKAPTCCHGLKSTALITFEPDTGRKSLKIKETYTRNLINFSSELLFTSLKPLVNLNLVLGCAKPQSYFAGADVQIDTNTNAINRHTLALSYRNQDLTVVTSVQNLSFFNTLVHQKVSEHRDIALSISYNKPSQEIQYSLVGQYKFPGSNNSFVKAKIDENSRVGLACGTTVKDGVQLSICGEIDGRNVDTGPHNIGLGISYES